MDENDTLSELNKIALVTIVPMAPVTPKSTSKLRSALHFRYSIVILCFIPIAILLSVSKNSKLNPNLLTTIITVVFVVLFDYNICMCSDYYCTQ